MAGNEQTTGSEEAKKTKAQPAGTHADTTTIAENGETEVRSNTPENAEHRLDPSAPGATGTTPRSKAK